METNPDASEHTGDLVILVIALRRKADSQHPFISIGRLDGNDVALPDPSVSKFHAYAKSVGAELGLLDARSRNGTKIDGVSIPRRGEGHPVILRSGQNIEIGGVNVMCVDATALLGLTSSIAGFF